MSRSPTKTVVTLANLPHLPKIITPRPSLLRSTEFGEGIKSVHRREHSQQKRVPCAPSIGHIIPVPVSFLVLSGAPPLPLDGHIGDQGSEPKSTTYQKQVTYLPSYRQNVRMSPPVDSTRGRGGGS